MTKLVTELALARNVCDLELLLFICKPSESQSAIVISLHPILTIKLKLTYI